MSVQLSGLCSSGAAAGRFPGRGQLDEASPSLAFDQGPTGGLGRVWMAVFGWACLHRCSLPMFGCLDGHLGQAPPMQDSFGSQALLIRQKRPFLGSQARRVLAAVQMRAKMDAREQAGNV